MSQMPEITIRPYISADCGALIEAFRMSVRQTGRRDYSQEQVISWAPDEIDAALFDYHRRMLSTWVAEIGGKTVGFSDLEADGHIGMLYVHPDYQGKGVASALLRTVESAAIEKELAHLYTEASIGARAVFERSGFHLIAPQTVVFNDQTFVNYRMEKNLRAYAQFSPFPKN